MSDTPRLTARGWRYRREAHTQALTITGGGVNKMSKWTDGVKAYAEELIEAYEAEKALNPNLKLTEKTLLNGASDWQAYSWGGNSLIYDADIAERLATPSETKRRTLGDGLSSWANSQEQWLDVQARALAQAARLVLEGEA